MSDETIQIEPETPATAARVRLRVVSGPHAGMSWTFIGETALTIGRLAPSQIRLPDEKAFSREHLRLVIRPPYAELLDDSSSNGTRVNGVRVLHATLSSGDKFGAGETEIVFELVGDLFSVTKDTPKSDLATLPSPPNDGDSTRLVRPSLATPVAKPAVASNAKLPTKELTATIAQVVMQPASDRDASPRTVGSYDLLRKLGQGGMATVYLAKHRGSGQEFAVKLIHSSAVISEKLIQLFAREASILSQLNHPRIVRCIEFGFHDGQPFLVMELINTIDLIKLVDGQPLEQRIRTSCWVASRILQALAYAHEKKFVHRDIKPGNILAYREAHRLQVKLADFGLAKCYEHVGFSAMTDEVSLRGTLAYMAPEQIKSSKTAGPPADLFATGACLYRLLVGKHPPMASMGAICSAKELSDLSIPKPLIDVLQKAMYPEATHRYAAATEMDNALRPFHGKA
jgi:eukaryotic-like serine/threonine-protein kinase